MGKADTFTKAYMSQNTVFADVFNFFVFGGDQVIKSESLHDENIEESAVILGSTTGDKKDQSVQKFRDIKKSAVIKQGDKALYILLALEDQSMVDPAIPVRCMLYDALEYDAQVKKAANHIREQHGAGMKGDEYIAGFSRRDHIIPVITLVVYFGTEKWDAPLSIHEMTAEHYDARIMKLVQDYRINLIQPATLSEEDFNKFATDFALVMEFLQVANDRKKIKELLSAEDSPYSNISTSAALVINSVTGIGIKINEETEKTNMCQGIKEWKEELIDEALTEERQKQQETMLASLLSTAKSLMKNLSLSKDQVLAAMDVPERDRDTLRAMLQS